MRTHPNTFQKVALHTYCDGTYSYLADNPEIDWTTWSTLIETMDPCTDFLFVSLLVELSSGCFGCVSAEDAVSRIDMAISDLEVVRDAIEEEIVSN